MLLKTSFLNNSSTNDSNIDDCLNSAGSEIINLISVKKVLSFCRMSAFSFLIRHQLQLNGLKRKTGSWKYLIDNFGHYSEYKVLVGFNSYINWTRMKGFKIKKNQWTHLLGSFPSRILGRGIRQLPEYKKSFNCNFELPLILTVKMNFQIEFKLEILQSLELH